jgi:hypothetical protein
MKLLIKMLGLGLIVAAAISYDRERLRRAGRLDAGSSGGRDMAPDADDMVVEAVIVGIAEVDPEPLANMAGEGIDPDAVDEAHRSVQEQRDQLPVSGKNLP